MKTRYIEQAIPLAPEAIYVDEFHLEDGGIVGITWPGQGRLHCRLCELREEVKS